MLPCQLLKHADQRVLIVKNALLMKSLGKTAILVKHADKCLASLIARMRLPLLVHDPTDLLLIETLLVKVLEELNQLLDICLEIWLGIVHLRHLLLPKLVLHLGQVKVHDQLLVIRHGDLIFTGILREVLQLCKISRATLRCIGWVLRELKTLLDVFH